MRLGGEDNIKRAAKDFKEALKFQLSDMVTKHRTTFNLGMVQRKLG